MFESAFCQILFYVFAVAALLCAVGVVAFRNPVTSAMNMALCFGFVAAIFFGMGAQFLGIVQMIVYAGAILVLFLFVVMMLDLNDEENGCSCSCEGKCCITRALCCIAHRLPLLGGVLVGCSFAAAVTLMALQMPGAKDGKCPCHALCDNVSALSLSGEQQPAAAPTPGINLVHAVNWDTAYVQPTKDSATLATVSGGALPALAPTAVNGSNDVKFIGNLLFTKYIIPFIILGFALLSGTVGAVALSRKIRKD